LSKQRDDILGFLSDHIATHGYSPSLREIAAAIDRSQTTVRYHVRILEKEGYVTREPRKARSLRIRGSGD